MDSQNPHAPTESPARERAKILAAAHALGTHANMLSSFADEIPLDLEWIADQAYKIAVEAMQLRERATVLKYRRDRELLDQEQAG